MSFRVVKKEGDRRALIDQYLKNRETLKKRVVQEKVGKQAFQREVASELQKPVVEQQKKLEEERQKKTDERQNALLAKLQENQEAITDKLDDQETALRQNILFQQQQLMQPQQPALAPAGVAASATATTPTTPRRPRVDLNPDVGIDPSVLQDMSLQPISSLLNSQVQDLEALHQQIQSPLRSLGAQSRGRNFTEEKRRQLETLKKYNSGLKLLIQGKKASIVPTTGQGIRTSQTKNPYKLTDDGMFGNLQIDLAKLYEFRVEAYKDGKKVLSRKADPDLIELLTKRYNTKKEYSQHALKTFEKLIDLSGMPLNTRSLKYTSTHQRSGSASVGGGSIRYYKTPDELVERLELLIGSKQGGKVSVEIDNEIANILDRLLKDGVITKKKYKQIHKNFIQ